MNTRSTASTAIPTAGRCARRTVGRRGLPGDRRRGLRRHAGHPGVAGPRVLPRPAPPRRGVQGAQPLRGRRRARRGAGLLGHGDRVRARHERRAARPARGPHAAEHPAALAGGAAARPPRHAHLAGAGGRGHGGRPAAHDRRPERLRAARAGRGHLHPPPPAARRTGDHRQADARRHPRPAHRDRPGGGRPRRALRCTWPTAAGWSPTP